MIPALGVTIEALEDFDRYLAETPDRARRAASRAINRVAGRDAIGLLRSGLTEQVDFPVSYLTGDRLGVTQQATPERPEAIITARRRPTSLSRFAINRGATNASPIVRVKPGRNINLQRAFFMKLRAGNAAIEDSFNLGLAIRLKPGETIENKNVTVKNAGRGLYLLYGPSVYQVFIDVADEITPQIADAVVDEFFRQMVLLSKDV